jgi:4-amino-4-deoxy-L-arabinose transferase-like glycosyltransferase
MQTENVNTSLNATSIEMTPPRATDPAVGTAPTRRWHRIVLGLIVVLAAFTSFFQLNLNGYGNTYYAAAVKSMLQSWHNFFFVSFDPGGFVTVDKPPLGLWIQAASAAVFGFSGFSLILPQALAGIACVIMLYYLVRRTFGPVAGLIAAFALAMTPISVVMNRDNNQDMTLVLTMVLGAWAIIRATETGKLRWLLLCALMVGLGFNIKTLEAYMVLPAFGLVYLLGAHQSWRGKLWRLGVALLLLLLVSFAWIFAVDLTPASERPYVGSSQTNSELELLVGYNGLSRLLGMNNGGIGSGNAGTRTQDANQERSSGTVPAQNTQDGTGNIAGNGGVAENGDAGNTPGGQNFGGGGAGGTGGGGGGNGFVEDAAGPFRLFKLQLGGQVGWLLPLALCGLCALAWQRRWLLRLRQPVLDSRQQAVVLWGLWLFAMGAFFSVASFFHPYYLVILAPAICALAGAGLVTLWHDYQQRTGWHRWALPVALLLTAAEQMYLLSQYQGWNWLEIVVVALCLLAVGVLVWKKRLLGPKPVVVDGATEVTTPVLTKRSGFVWQSGAVGVGLMALLLTPVIWSGLSVYEPANSTLPSAGPATANRGFGGMTGIGGNRRDGAYSSLNAENGNGANAEMGTLPTDGNTGNTNNTANAANGITDEANIYTQGVDSKLVSYLQKNKGNAKFLVATTSSQTAAPIIIATGEAVMAMGGFSGSDPILTQETLAALVKNGTVRYFLTQSGGMGGGASSTNQTSEQTPEGVQPGYGQSPEGVQPGYGQSPEGVQPGYGQPPEGTQPGYGQSPEGTQSGYGQTEEQTQQDGAQFGGGGGMGGQSELTSWITANCSSVATSEYSSSSSTSQSTGGFGGGGQLYDCGNAK